MIDLLFVYGTLMRGYDHPMSRLLSSNAAFEGEARCRGRLHLIRHYPGLVLSDDRADIVHWRTLSPARARDRCCAEFDMYEACGEGFKEPTEYLRQVLPASRRGDGVLRVEAWTYLYNWPVDKVAADRVGDGYGAKERQSCRDTAL